MEPIGLHAEQFHHLAATGHEFGQVLAVGISERTCFGTNAFGEQSDDLRVQRVGLGEPPCGPGKKSRIWRGLSTASGKLALARAAATVISNPPVASSTISVGAEHANH